MPQDFVKRAAQHKRQIAQKEPSKVPTGLIIITLITVTGLAGFLYYLTMLKPEAESAPGEPEQQTTVYQQQQKQAKPQTKTSEESYDFYTLLPDSEVIAPKVEEYSSTLKQTSDEKAYLLQAGSFRNPKDADRLRAKLIMRGLEPRVQQVSAKDGSTWHRLLLGPFESRSKLNHAQDILADANTESMLIKINPGKNNR